MAAGKPRGTRRVTLSTVLLSVSIFVVGQVAAALTLLLLVPDLLNDDGLAVDIEPWQTFLASMSWGVAMVLCLWFVLHRHTKGLRGVAKALGLRRPVARDIGYAAGYYAMYFFAAAAMIFVVMTQSLVEVEDGQSIGFDEPSGWGLIAAFAAIVVVAPIVEELLFRGFLYNRLKKLQGQSFALVVSSLLFGLAHLYGETWQVLVVMDTALLSVFMVLAYEKTGNLLTPVVIHMFKNLVAFMALFVIV